MVTATCANFMSHCCRGGPQHHSGVRLLGLSLCGAEMAKPTRKTGRYEERRPPSVRGSGPCGVFLPESSAASALSCRTRRKRNGLPQARSSSALQATTGGGQPGGHSQVLWTGGGCGPRQQAGLTPGRPRAVGAWAVGLRRGCTHPVTGGQVTVPP